MTNSLHKRLGDGSHCLYLHNRSLVHKGYKRFGVFLCLAVASFALRFCMWWRFENHIFDSVANASTSNYRGTRFVAKTDLEYLSILPEDERIQQQQHNNSRFTDVAKGNAKHKHHSPRVFTLTESVPNSFSPDSPLLREHSRNTPDPILDDNRPRSHEVDRSTLEDHLLAGQFTEDYQTHCVDMMDWQSKSYPICNSVHELGVLGGSPLDVYKSRLGYLGRGNWRSSFRIRAATTPHAQDSEETVVDGDGDYNDDDTVVLKLYNLHNDDEFPFDPLAYEMHRIDALISQKMTASPYVIDIYGYCATTALYEQGIVDLDHKARARTSKKKEKDSRRFGDSSKFQCAAQLAFGLADLHGIDYPGGNNATIVHGDIKPENMFLTRTRRAAGNRRSGGSKSGRSSSSTMMAKLGDFNISVLRKWNKTSHKPCPHYHNEYPLDWGLGYKPVEHSQKGYPPLDESIDVFGIGGVLYYILVGKDPYFRYPKGNETRDMKAGKLPPLPVSVTTTTLGGGNDGNPEEPDGSTVHEHLNSIRIRTVAEAIRKTMALRPRDRPSAKEIADYFLASEMATREKQ